MINTNSRIISRKTKSWAKALVSIILSFSYLKSQPLKETQQHITALKRNIAMLEQLMRKSGGDYKTFHAYPQTATLLEDTKRRTRLMLPK